MSRPVVVVGGGITGLAAAHELQKAGREFLVLETSRRLGGKVHTRPVGNSGLDFPVDTAADGFLARVPDVIELCHEIGLGDDLVAPATNQAFIWSDSALRPIPTPSVLGVPLEVDSLKASGIVSPAGVADFAARIDFIHAPLQGDASVGEVLRPRVGDEVFERIVDPLLGGINAGCADELSIDTGAAVLAQAARRGGPFRAALLAGLAGTPSSSTDPRRSHAPESPIAARARAAESSPAPSASVPQAMPAASQAPPVFNGIRGGTGRLVQALAERLGSRVRLGEAVTSLLRPGPRGGWKVRMNRGRRFSPPDEIEADGVILAVPGWTAAGLVAPYAPEGARHLHGLEYSNVLMATFVVDRAAIDHPLDGSGFLVPRHERLGMPPFYDGELLMTACSWTSSKWAHCNDGTRVVLRVSTHDGEGDNLGNMESLGPLLTMDLRKTIGLRGEPVVRLSPWPRSLPQYRPGHLDRCDQLDAELAANAPGLVVCGAAARGLGLPACIRQGREAARRLVTQP